MVCCGSCGQGLGKRQAYVGGCFSVFNTLPTKCFLSSTEMIQRGTSEHPRDSLPFSSRHLPVWLDGVHGASIVRHSEQTGPPLEICSKNSCHFYESLLIHPDVRGGRRFYLLFGKLLQNLGGWNSANTRLVLNNVYFEMCYQWCFFITIVSNSWLRYVYVCVLWVRECAVLTEARRLSPGPWSWSSRLLWATLHGLWDPNSSVLHWWVISSAHDVAFHCF